MSKTFGRGFSPSGLVCSGVLGYVGIAGTVAGGSNKIIHSMLRETMTV